MSYLFEALASAQLHSRYIQYPALGFLLLLDRESHLLEYGTIWREYVILHDGYARY